jgi:dipeptidyl aminopeptidase/acylaminoacyl peptidase
MRHPIVRVASSALCLALLWSAASTMGAPSGTDQQAPAKRPLTLETMGGGGGGGGFGGGGVSISPDGKWVALGGQNGLRLQPVDGSAEPRPWFQGAITAWFPDSQKVLTTRQGDLWSVPIDSATATQITKDEANERAPAISPDGKWIAFSSTRGGQNDVWIVAADGSAAPRQLTQSAMPEDESRFGPVWSPDGKTIAYVSNKSEYWHDDIWLVDVASGKARQLTRGIMASETPVWSPDGKQIAVLGSSKKGYWYMDLYDIFLIDPVKGTERPVKMQVYATGDLTWSGDSSRLYFTYQERGDVNIYSVPAAGGVATKVTNDRGVMRGLVATANADGFVFTRATPADGTGTYYLPGIGGPPRQLVAGAVGYEGIREPREIAYRSFDGLYIQGFLYLPPNMSAGAKYPALVHVHGGGTNSTLRTQALMEQYLSSKGYVVLAINYRGGSGFGREFQDLGVNDWASGQAHDAAMAADFLRSLPYVNGKVGIYGYSYGGIMSMATIARHPGKFDAAVPMAGIYDFGDAYTNADRLGKVFIRTGHGGSPEDRKETYAISNTLARVKNITTPLLVMHGEADVRAPFRQYQMVVKLLKEHNKVFESKSYPNEPHGFRDPANRLDMNRRMEAFFEKYLKGTSTSNQH